MNEFLYSQNDSVLDLDTDCGTGIASISIQSENMWLITLSSPLLSQRTLPLSNVSQDVNTTCSGSSQVSHLKYTPIWGVNTR